MISGGRFGVAAARSTRAGLALHRDAQVATPRGATSRACPCRRRRAAGCRSRRPRPPASTVNVPRDAALELAAAPTRGRSTWRSGTTATDVGAHARDAAARRERGQLLRMAADRAHHQRQAAALRVEDPLEPVVLRAVLDARSRARSGCTRPARGAARRACRRAPGAARSASSGTRSSRARSRTARPWRFARATRSQRLREVVRDRLVADDVEARVERRGRERVVRVVGRHDRDGVDAVGRAPSPSRSARRSSP